MHRAPSARPTRAALVAVTLIVTLAAASCGVEVGDGPLAGGTAPEGSSPTVTAPLPPCPPDEAGGTGGAIGLDDLDPTCEPLDETTTTTAPDEDGGDDTTTTEADDEQQGSPDQVYLDAMIESLRESDSEDLQFTDEQAECLAPQWLETITVDALREADITPEDLASDDVSVDLAPILDQDQGREMVDAFGDCGVDLETVFVEGLSADGSIEADQAACLADALPDGYVEQLFAITLADGDEALDEDPALAETLTDAYLGCSD